MPPCRVWPVTGPFAPRVKIERRYPPPLRCRHARGAVQDFKCANITTLYRKLPTRLQVQKPTITVCGPNVQTAAHVVPSHHVVTLYQRSDIRDGQLGVLHKWPVLESNQRHRRGNPRRCAPYTTRPSTTLRRRRISNAMPLIFAPVSRCAGYVKFHRTHLTNASAPRLLANPP